MEKIVYKAVKLKIQQIKKVVGTAHYCFPYRFVRYTLDMDDDKRITIVDILPPRKNVEEPPTQESLEADLNPRIRAGAWLAYKAGIGWAIVEDDEIDQLIVESPEAELSNIGIRLRNAVISVNLGPPD